MSDALSQELLAIIYCLIKPDHSLNVPFTEYLSILLGSETRLLARLSLINRSHKRCELSWQDPVDISVLYSLIVLVLLDVEGLKIVPLVLDGEVESLQAVQDGALVVTLTLRRIAERDKLVVIRLESLVGLLWLSLEDDDHESAHEEGSVDELLGLARAVVEDPIVLVLLILHTRTQRFICGIIYSYLQ